jgi:hypothetical protein
MLSFEGIARSLGLRSWKEAQPDLHRDIILGIETRATDCKSVAGFDFIRGWYTTWIIGPETEGCGMHQQHVLDIDPSASLRWQHHMVMLVDLHMEISGSLCPGVVPQELFDTGWWGYSDALVNTPQGSLRLADVIDLQAGVYKTRIRHKGKFHPPKVNR